MDTNKIREAVEKAMEDNKLEVVAYGIVPELLREIEKLKDTNDLLERVLESRLK